MQPKNLMAVLMIITGAIRIGMTFVLGALLSGFAFIIPIEDWVMAGLAIAVGVGLLRRTRWARWLAVGYCFLAIIGAVITPIVVLLFSRFIEFAAAILMFGKLPAVRWMIYAVVVLQIGYGYVAWLTYKYLQSEEGLKEFQDLEPRNPRQYLSYAALVWMALPMVLPGFYRIPRHFLPQQATVASMRKASAPDVVTLAQQGFLTADGRHMVFMGGDIEDLYLLDLQSGDLTQTKRHGYIFSSLSALSLMTSTDGSAFIYPDGTLETWPDGRTHKLKSFGRDLRSAVVGFASSDRLLVHQGAAGNLELIDTKADRPLWSTKVADADGVSRPAEENMWPVRATAWSAKRDQFAWSDGVRAYVVSLNTGSVREVAQMDENRLFVKFSPDGSELLVSPHVLGGQRKSAKGLVVDLASGQSTELLVEGLVIHFGGRGGEAVSMGSSLLVRRPVQGTEVPVREVRLPSNYTLLEANAGGFARGEGGLIGPIFAVMRDDAQLPFWQFSSAPSKTIGMSSDGRSVVMAEGARIDVYDTASLVAGAPQRRSIDLAEAKRLSPPQSVQFPQQETLRWRQRDRAPEAAVVPTVDTLAVAAESSATTAAASPATMTPALTPALTPTPTQTPTPTPTPTPTAGPQSPRAVENAATSGSAEPQAPPDPNRILKCRDASGSVSYQKGYCPPGSTSVDAPAITQTRTPSAGSSATAAGARGRSGDPAWVEFKDMTFGRVVHDENLFCDVGGRRRRVWFREALVILKSGERKTYYMISTTRLYLREADARAAACTEGDLM